MADMMYRLVLRAQFENQAELTKAIEGLNQLQFQGAKVNVTMGGVGRQSSESFSGLARSVMSVGFMFNMMESALMRQEMAMMMAESAQNRLNDAIQRYGANSEQARRAAKQMEAETSYLNAANIRANVSMGLMITNLILQSKVLEAATMKQIIHTAVTAASTIKEWLHVAALQARALWQAIVSGGLAVPLMVAGAAIGGAALGTYMGSRETGGSIQKTGTYLLHEGETVLSKDSTQTILNNSKLLESKESSQSRSKSLEKGGTIEKEGYFHLHSGEEVLSKETVENNKTFLNSVKESKISSSSAMLLSTLKELKNSTATNTFMSTFSKQSTESMIPLNAGHTLSTFNFETHLHVETDLDKALEENNRRIRNEYKRNVP